MNTSNDTMAMPVGTPEERIEKALAIIVKWGGIDGAHHKDWVLDQAVRALTGCPVAIEQAEDINGVSYSYARQTNGEAYEALVAQACDGEDGPDTYGWEEGIAP